MINRLRAKIRQIRDYFFSTQTPVALTLDALRLKRHAFVAVNREGLRLRVNPSVGEGFTFYENLVRKDYLSRGIVLNAGDTVVDVGANIGSFAILAGSVVGVSGRVITFEPMPATYERLRANLELNGLQQVKPVCAAVDATAGELIMTNTTKSALASAHLSGRVSGDHSSVAVPCLTLDAIATVYELDRIHLLKVDCEGSEYGIFETLSAQLAERIDQIVMEVHPVNGKSEDKLAETLGGLGFNVRRYGCNWYAFNRISPATS